MGWAMFCKGIQECVIGIVVICEEVLGVPFL